MNLSTDMASSGPSEFLKTKARNFLSNALDAHRKGLSTYESLKNLGEVIGTEYGDRVLFELIQNAHDAHEIGESGAITIKFVKYSETEGRLYVANRGHGFRERDVSAIMNLATSGKEVGEGIGNKGLGFRSIEAITDDVRIYSRSRNRTPNSFDGYCFRFAQPEEIRRIILSELSDQDVQEGEADRISRTIPRYLVPRPLDEISPEVERFAAAGHATVVDAPLRSSSTIDLVERQVGEIANLEHPLLLFLDRISKIRIEVEIEGKTTLRRRLTRRQKILREGGGPGNPRISEIDVGEGRRFLLVRQEVDKERVIAAVRESIDQAPALKRWLDWKGQPSVSVAVGMSTAAVTRGQLYNFLPMAGDAGSPLLGHIDAPFFADIDRRNAELNLPLNSMLMDAVSETCLSGALTAVRERIDVPRRSVFDLIAWTGGVARKLDDAVRVAGLELKDLCLVPIIPTKDGERWSTINEVTVWPEGDFQLLKPREVVKHVGVHLTSSDLDSQRIARLREMAGRCWGRCIGCQYTRLPSGNAIPCWSEIYAESLVRRSAKPRTWTKFYRDLVTLCEASEVELNCLDGAAVLLDRAGKLRSAGGHDVDGRRGLYVRGASETGKRKKGDVPLPPASLTKSYRFFDEKIALPENVLKALSDAGLVRQFDPIKALSGLGVVLGKKPSDRRRIDALNWAFRVWDAAGKSAEDAVMDAGLYVPTIGGWVPTDGAVFSGTWTELGKRLEAFLSEASEYSQDCQHSRNQLLKPLDEWVSSTVAVDRKWRAFLELLGVSDGLKEIAPEVQRKGCPAYHWNNLLQNEDAARGLTKKWTKLACSIFFKHPFKHPRTDYELKGEFWRLPGQNEYGEFPDHLRESFHELLVHHIDCHGNKFLSARIGRYDRPKHNWDEHRVPTPLGAFLRSGEWLRGELRGERMFLSPNKCWASRTRRPGVPAFMPCLSDDARALVDRDEVAEIAFGGEIGLLDWASPKTAVPRLVALANRVEKLQYGEIQTFRRQYSRAWKDLAESHAQLPPNLPLAVHQFGSLTRIEGREGAQTRVILVEDAQGFESRALSAAGVSVLELGEANPEAVKARLRHIEAYSAEKLDRDTVRLLVDGSFFVPTVDDGYLVSAGLDWLPEVVVIANEVKGENLERGILPATLDKRVRLIRVRRCKSISLMVAGQEMADGGNLQWYAYQDEASPTLILTDGITIDWPRLAGDLAAEISKLVDPRLRSLEWALLRLARGRPDGSLERPTETELASALKCDVKIVEDLRAGMRTDLAHLLHLVRPVVAYFENIDLVRDLDDAAKDQGPEFSLRDWLEAHLSEKSPAVADLLDACEGNPDRRSIVSTLDLDYGQFNRVLQSLGEETLSSEAGMQATFEAYLREMAPILRDRLRRLHLEDYRLGRDLSMYTAVTAKPETLHGSRP